MISSILITSIRVCNYMVSNNNKRINRVKTKFEFPSRGFWIVSDKIGEADYFLEQLKRSQAMYEEFGYNLSAYVSATRSITFSLQAVMCHYPNFSEWYKPYQEKLRKNDLAKYFANLRNHLQKVGNIPINYSGSMKNGMMEVDQRFIPIEELKDAPKGEVIELAEQYLIDILKVIKECYIDYHEYVNPNALFTMEGLSKLGWSIEDLEESLGLPRGWTDIEWDGDDKNEQRLMALSRHGGDESTEQYFEKYSI
jgi:hypothetical protein